MSRRIFRSRRGIGQVSYPDPVAIWGSNLVLWLRSDLGITTVSGLVSNWADQSGKGHHASQGTAANRPSIATADTVFGFPTISFTTNQMLQITHTTDFQTLTPGLSIYVVGAWLVGSTGSKTIIGKGHDPGTTTQFDFKFQSRNSSSTVARWQPYNTNGAAYDLDLSAIHDGAQHVLRGRNLTNIAYGSIDRAADTTNGPRTGFAVGPYDMFVNASGNTGDVERGQQKVAEIVIIKKFTTAAEDTAWWNYYNHRYGKNL